MLCFLASGRGSEVWRRECDMSTRSALLARRGKNELRVGITRYYTNIDEVGEGREVPTTRVAPAVCPPD